MWKSGVAALLAAAVISPVLAQPDEFDQGMDTLWEVLWHQSGTPTRLVRWEQDIKVRIFGVNLAQHKQHTLQALTDVAGEAGVKVIDVSGQPGRRPAGQRQHRDRARQHAGRQPALRDLPEFPDRDEDRLAPPCRCATATPGAAPTTSRMHVMGVRGHPAGKTVLSYFPTKVDGLLPLDKVMLHAWYSPRMHGGMTPVRGAARAGRRAGRQHARQGPAAAAGARPLLPHTIDADAGLRRRQGRHAR